MSTALVIEDSSAEREIIITYLQQVGVNALIAKSGEEGLEKLQQSIPDLIILDIVLPGRSGFEICRDLKSSEKTSKIPVIMCSTKNSEMDKFWGMKQGADAYLSKPLNKEEFVGTVNKLIKK